jgi:hypothetical protein
MLPAEDLFVYVCVLVHDLPHRCLNNPHNPP